VSEAGGPVPDGPVPDHSEDSPQEPEPGATPADPGGAEPDGPFAGVAADADSDTDLLEAVELARRFEAERDEYLDHLRRLQAEFENFKRRAESQAAAVRDRAAIDLVRELLPVLDTCDAALSHGNTEIEPIHNQLLQTLEKLGLQPVAEDGVVFDPNIHEAVMHEPGDGESVVAEVMRTGYLWKDSVVRAAMVKVRG
jgi:molecular chaperone GrpE